MPIPVITSIISACSILAGSALGAWFSWIINNKMHKIAMEEQYNLTKYNRDYEDLYKVKEVCQNANVIRLDLCTAIYQSIRMILKKDSLNYIYPIPINKNFSCSVASLSDKYDVKELSYLYQLYGIIEKVNTDILNLNIDNKQNKNKIILGFISILNKIYGDNYKKILEKDIEKISYEELYDNEYIKEGYKKTFIKLSISCKEEEIKRKKISNNSHNEKMLKIVHK